MIIGLEWLVIALAIVTFIFILITAFTCNTCPKLSICTAVVMVVALGSMFGLFTGLMGAQADVEKQYVNYLNLQTKVVQYEDLDLFEQYKVYEDVMTYNLWYERNKSDLENEWSFKGTSAYAKEFDYIVIGG
jgi:membrane-bound ClpP family serine protease